MCTYLLSIFRTFANFSLRTSTFRQIGKTLSTRTPEARADTMVEVSARSVHSGARGRRSKFFFRREWIRRFPWFRYESPYFVRTYRYNNAVCFFAWALMSYERTVRTYTGHATDNMHRSHRCNGAAHTTHPYA